MNALDVRAYAVMDPDLKVIYAIVAGTSEHDVIRRVNADREMMLFGGARGVQEIEARDVEELVGDRWFEVAPLDLPSGGDCGGDFQASDSVTRRFARPQADTDLWSVLTVYWYLTDDSKADWVDRRLGPRLERQEEYVVCRDLHFVGDTEEWCDYRHLFEQAWEPVEANVKVAARDFNPIAEISWNGRPFR